MKWIISLHGSPCPSADLAAQIGAKVAALWCLTSNARGVAKPRGDSMPESNIVLNMLYTTQPKLSYEMPVYYLVIAKWIQFVRGGDRMRETRLEQCSKLHTSNAKRGSKMYRKQPVFYRQTDWRIAMCHDQAGNCEKAALATILLDLLIWVGRGSCSWAASNIWT